MTSTLLALQCAPFLIRRTAMLQRIYSHKLYTKQLGYESHKHSVACHHCCPASSLLAGYPICTVACRLPGPLLLAFPCSSCCNVPITMMSSKPAVLLAGLHTRPRCWNARRSAIVTTGCFTCWSFVLCGDMCFETINGCLSNCSSAIINQCHADHEWKPHNLHILTHDNNVESGMQ